MSTATKWIIGLVVVVAAAWGLWASGWLNKPAAPASQTSAAANSAATSTAPINGMSASNDASDAAMAQDAAAIDTQMQGLSSDSAATDASMNDKPGAQSF